MTLVRHGTAYGGWVIPEGVLGTESVCYLAGAGEDISFDCSIARYYGCQVHIFDPTPRAIAHVENVISRAREGLQTPINNDPSITYAISPREVARLHLHPVGLWSETTSLKFFAPRDPGHVSHSVLNIQQTEAFFEAPVMSLAEIMDMLGHKHIDLLKLDTEGAEYEIIASLVRDKIVPTILCVEFHNATNPNAGIDENCLLESIEKLKSIGLTIIHQDGLDLTFVNDSILPH
ncbi:MAG: FkbM family methyltransferase [Alphaproteobacteria bacterium]|nr:FkbM family methyltransferase [Alphaproteobacteria bacterium]